MPCVHTHNIHTHTQQPSFHSHTPSQHTTFPMRTRTHSSFHTHTCSHKQNIRPHIHAQIHTQNSLHTLTPIHTTRPPSVHTHIHSAPPSTAVSWEDFCRQAEGHSGGGASLPPYPSPLQSPGLRTTPGFQELAGEEGAARGLGTAGMPQLESPTFLPVGAAHLAAAGSRCVLEMQVCGERRRGGEQAPGPWHSLARMLGAETSSLRQPDPGPPKVGSGMAGLGGEVGRPSREDDEHLVIGSVKSQAADAARVGVGGGALGPLIRTGDPYSLRGSYVFPAQPGGHGLCPGLGSQPCARCPLCGLGTPVGDCRITGPAAKVPLARHLHLCHTHTHTHTRFLQSTGTKSQRHIQAYPDTLRYRPSSSSEGVI